MSNGQNPLRPGVAVPTPGPAPSLPRTPVPPNPGEVPTPAWSPGPVRPKDM